MEMGLWDSAVLKRFLGAFYGRSGADVLGSTWWSSGTSPAQNWSCWCSGTIFRAGHWLSWKAERPCARQTLSLLYYLSGLIFLKQKFIYFTLFFLILLSGTTSGGSWGNICGAKDQSRINLMQGRDLFPFFFFFLFAQAFPLLPLNPQNSPEQLACEFVLSCCFSVW